MSDKQIDVKVTASAGGVRPGMTQAEEAVRQSTGRMRDQLGRFVAQARADGQQLGGFTAPLQQGFAGLGSSMAGALASLRGLAAGYLSLQAASGMVRMADEAMLMTARLAQVTGGTAQATAAQRDLFVMAQRLQAPFTELQSTFARIMPAVTALKGGVREATALTEILVSTARLSGASAVEAGASAQQFTQALGSGVLQGDELRSILENNQTLARELAAALGVSIGELRKLGEQGKLTSDVVANALLGRYDAIKRQTAELPQTVGGGFTQIANAVNLLTGALNASDGPLAAFARAMGDVAKVVEIAAAGLRAGRGETSAFGEIVTTVFSAIGKAAAYVVDVFRAVFSVVEIVSLAFRQVGRDIGSGVAILVQVGQGNFRGALEMMRQRGEETADTNARMAASFREAALAVAGMGKTVQAYNALSGPADYSNEGRTGGGLARLQGPPPPPAPKAEPSQMPQFEARLDAERLAAAEMDALRGMTKQAEVDFWSSILNTQKLSAADRLAVERKLTDARLSIMQEDARNAQQITGINVAAWRDGELSKVAIAQEAAKTQQALGQLTQSQLLAQEEQFEARRREIRLAALQAQLAVLDPARDPVQVAQIQAQIEALEQAHQQKIAQIRGQAAVASAKEQAATWGDAMQRISGLWDKGVQALMNGTFTWAGAMKAVGAELVGWTSGIIKRQVAQWWAGEQAKTGATAAGTAQRLAMEGMAAVKSVALWAWTAAKNIMASAWEAMAGAYKAVAGIPFVGPVLAPVAAGTAFAAVAALAGRVASARNGYDIPAGVNPLTQLHEREMVLPAKQADVIRDMADNGGPGGAPINVSIQALDGASVRRVLMDNSSALAEALRGAHRRFAV